MYNCLVIASLLFSNFAFCKTPVNHPFVPSNNNSLAGDSIFILKGKISGPHKGFIKIYYKDANGKSVKDSIAIVNGTFTFSGIIKEPTRAFLEGIAVSKGPDDPNGVSVFLEPATVTIELEFNKFKSATIKGSRTEEEYQVLARSIDPVNKEKEPLNKEFNDALIPYNAAVKAKKAQAEIDSLRNILEGIRERIQPHYKRINQLHYDFFAKYPQSFVTALYLRSFVANLTLDSLRLFYSRLGPTQQSTYGKQIALEIDQLEAGQPGSMAKGFSSKELNGQQLSLSDYKGKHVLLDFWASWCIPCRQGNPHLKKLYAKYKDKGIEFIGIADDDDADDKWKAAITKDGIGIWKHVLRGLKYVNDKADRSEDISDKFGVQTLPTIILINKEGIIIGRFDENEAALDEMLKKIFGN